jgi:hypothetical protein
MVNTYLNRELCWSALDFAEVHINEGDMADSAKACWEQGCAIMRGSLDGKKDITGADYWALRSLAYSVGVFHEHYKAAAEELAKIEAAAA